MTVRKLPLFDGFIDYVDTFVTSSILLCCFRPIKGLV